MVHRVGRAHDGYNPWETPDNVSMAGVALAIAAGGALRSSETTVLLTVEETLDALRAAEASQNMSIETSRLSLLPSSPQQVLALIEEPVRFAELTGFAAADGLRKFFVSDDVSPEWLAALRRASSPDPWRHGFFVVERGERRVIGSAGFKGPPDSSGVVEIAYGIVPIAIPPVSLILRMVRCGGGSGVPIRRGPTPAQARAIARADGTTGARSDRQ